MANGEKTQAFVLSIIETIGGTFTEKFADKVAEAKQTATNVVIIDQIQKLVMTVGIIAAIWYFTRARK